MNTKLPDSFSDALRAELVEVVRNSRKRRWSRKWTISAVVAIVTVSAAGTATAISNLLPGAPVIEELSATSTYSFAGSQTIELGTPPDGASGLSLSFTCHSPGRYQVSDSFSVECSDGEPNSVSFNTVDLPPDSTLQVTAPPTAEWDLAVAFINSTTTPWATNASGQTYGVSNEHGSPDLIAVIADDGNGGYVSASDLADANGETAAESFASPEDALRWQESVRGTSVSMPVYLYDGLTQIGTFTIHR